MSKRRFLSFFSPALVCLISISCSTARLPTVSDYGLERRVAEEAAPIIRVTEDREHAADYRFMLSDFPRKDILGMSVGRRRIYVSYTLARLAFESPRSRWLLRQILAHEIAHEISGHANHSEAAAFDRSTAGAGVTAADIGLPSGVQFRHYSVEKELEADLRGMTYWSNLQWDCRIWVRILKGFEREKYAGDIFHPTDRRLAQALRACPQGADNVTSPAVRPSASAESAERRAQ